MTGADATARSGPRHESFTFRFAGLYPRRSDFEELVPAHDPAAKFRIDFIARHFPAG